MVSPINFKAQNTNFTPQPVGVVNPNANNQNQAQQGQNQPANPAAMNLRSPEISKLAKNAGNTAAVGFKTVLIGGAAIAIGLLALFKGSKLFSASKQLLHMSALDKLIPITSIDGLKGYLDAVAKDSNEYMKTAQRKVKITFNPESYAKEPAKINFLNLDISEINNLKKDKARIKDIAQSINGILEVNRRTGSKNGLNLTMYNVSPAQKEAFINHLKANNGILNPQSPGIRDILPNVMQVESTSGFKGINFVNYNNYKQRGNPGFLNILKETCSYVREKLEI